MPEGQKQTLKQIWAAGSKEEKKQVAWYAIAILLALVSAFAIVVIVAIVFPPSSDDNLEPSCIWFLLGLVFVPNAFKRYREARKGEKKVAWSQSPELLFCLSVVCIGPVFALSIIDRWIENALYYEIPLPSLVHTVFHWPTGTTIAQGAFFVLSLAFFLLAGFQNYKRRKITDSMATIDELKKE